MIAADVLDTLRIHQERRPQMDAMDLEIERINGDYPELAERHFLDAASNADHLLSERDDYLAEAWISDWLSYYGSGCESFDQERLQEARK